MTVLDYCEKTDTHSQERYIETSLMGKQLLMIPQLNKGTAFPLEERLTFELLGKLPPTIENLDTQVKRAYLQLQNYETDFQRHIYLNNLHDTNQVLFYKLVQQYLNEMMPLIYTPHIAVAVREFSQQFRRSRGLYLDYLNQDHMDAMLQARSNPEIDLIVVTDGESVLGIGDQGIGAINITIGKLMVYTLCGGIDPARTLPIMLDVGTNNQDHLRNPFYLGWRHERLTGDKYFGFIQNFIRAVKRNFPHVFLHWEDVSYTNAYPILNYCAEQQICSFNDDIQGTGATALATILAAIQLTEYKSLPEQRIVIFGPGAAGMGIADQIYKALLRSGLSEHEARQRFWLIGRKGLLTTQSQANPTQQPYLRPFEEVQSWSAHGLYETVQEIKPTILIGTSSLSGAFNEKIIQTMAAHVKRPIILPLSNPNANCEAHPADLLAWTKGQALIATGSPYPPIFYEGQTFTIAQCNNAFIFPGLGLGVTATQAERISDGMLWAACAALSECSPAKKHAQAPLLPKLEQSLEVAARIAYQVGATAISEGLSTCPLSELQERIQKKIWEPKYVALRKKEVAIL